MALCCARSLWTTSESVGWATRDACKDAVPAVVVGAAAGIAGITSCADVKALRLCSHERAKLFCAQSCEACDRAGRSLSHSPPATSSKSPPLPLPPLPSAARGRRGSCLAEARASGPQTEEAPSTRKRSAERAPDREREHPVAVSPTGTVPAVRPIVTV